MTDVTQILQQIEQVEEEAELVEGWHGRDELAVRRDGQDLAGANGEGSGIQAIELKLVEADSTDVSSWLKMADIASFRQNYNQAIQGSPSYRV